jgi:hypothetical protein
MAERQRRDEVALPSCHDFSGGWQVTKADRDIRFADHDVFRNVFNDLTLFWLLKFDPSGVDIFSLGENLVTSLSIGL